MVVWPEYSIPVDFINFREEFRNRVIKFAKEKEVNLIIGTMDYDSNFNKHQDIALFISSTGEILGYSPSLRPAPRNEGVMPGIHKKELSFFVEGSEIKIKTSICFEEFFPAEKKTETANLLVVISNDRDTGSGINLASIYSRYRAAEENLPLVRSANTGVSQIIDSSGRVLEKIEANKKGYLITELILKEI